MTDDKKEVSYKDLIELQQKFQDAQLGEIVKQLADIREQFCLIRKTIETVAIEQALIKATLHATPCPYMLRMENTFAERQKQDTDSRFKSWQILLVALSAFLGFGMSFVTLMLKLVGH